MENTNSTIESIVNMIPDDLRRDFYDVHGCGYFPSQPFEEFMDIAPDASRTALQQAWALSPADKQELARALLSAEEFKNVKNGTYVGKVYVESDIISI